LQYDAAALRAQRTPAQLAQLENVPARFRNSVVFEHEREPPNPVTDELLAMIVKGLQAQAASADEVLAILRKRTTPTSALLCAHPCHRPELRPWQITCPVCFAATVSVVHVKLDVVAPMAFTFDRDDPQLRFKRVGGALNGPQCGVYYKGHPADLDHFMSDFGMNGLLQVISHHGFISASFSLTVLGDEDAAQLLQAPPQDAMPKPLGKWRTDYWRPNFNIGYGGWRLL
jgi:hypothetical protein